MVIALNLLQANSGKRGKKAFVELSKLFRHNEDEDDKLQVCNGSCYLQRDLLLPLKQPGQPLSDVPGSKANRGL